MKKEDDKRIEQMGQTAYDAFRNVVKDINGRPMEDFHELPEELREKWSRLAYGSTGEATIHFLSKWEKTHV